MVSLATKVVHTLIQKSEKSKGFFLNFVKNPKTHIFCSSTFFSSSASIIRCSILVVDMKEKKKIGGIKNSTFLEVLKNYEKKVLN